MTIEEALDKLQEYLYYAKILEFKHMTVSVDALEVAVQTLEKQIPKKVSITIGGMAHCPNCENSYLGTLSFGSEYCDQCGQRLDWNYE